MIKMKNRVEHLNDQKAWMQACGETLSGYIDHYTKMGRTVEEAKAIFHADVEALQRLQEVMPSGKTMAKEPTKKQKQNKELLALLWHYLPDHAEGHQLKRTAYGPKSPEGLVEAIRGILKA